MGLSFTGEAAQDRDCGDHSLHPGGASSISPSIEQYAIQRNYTIRGENDLSQLVYTCFFIQPFRSQERDVEATCSVPARAWEVTH
jgi:hypothetical protein